ncbi:phage tail tube protein [Bacillus sp. UNC322MFChir4.1]|uniref:phage tail tube protein n=1 Tax=Bacillus sp. UNC322MFChir4.1 TaxID=1449045 RepID=UPI000555832E|nr:phage tail tube protein [Bacillus sp. UNC322MFChir4.1]
MPYGSLSHIGLGKETAWGTPVAATDYIRFASEGITEEIEQVISENITGVFDEGATYEGAHNISGDISFDVYPNMLGHMLRSAFGAPTTTTVTAGVYQHVFTPLQSNFSNVCALPSYTLEVNRDLEQAFQYAGAVVNELTLNFGTDNKIMQGSASILARKLALITKTVPSLEATNPFLWNQATITLDGTVNKDVTTIEFGISNELEARGSLDGTREVSRILRNGVRTFPVKFSAELQNMTDYNKFRAQNEVPLKIELVGGVISGANNYKLTVEIPKFRFAAYPINVDGAGSLIAQVDGSAKYDQTSTFAMKITLVNSKASY